MEQEAIDERMLKTGTVPVADQLNNLPAAANGERKCPSIYTAFFQRALKFYILITNASLSIHSQRQRESRTRRRRGRGSRTCQTTGRNGNVMYNRIYLSTSCFFFSWRIDAYYRVWLMNRVPFRCFKETLTPSLIPTRLSFLSSSLL